MGAAGAIAVTAEYAAGMSGLLATALVWGPLLAAGTASCLGRSVIGWIPIVGDWWLRRVVGATRQLHRLRDRGATTGGLRLELPGIRSPLPVTAGSSGAALVSDRPGGTAAALCAIGGGLVSWMVLAHWLESPVAYLGSLACAAGGYAVAMVVERWWAGRGAGEASDASDANEASDANDA